MNEDNPKIMINHIGTSNNPFGTLQGTSKVGEDDDSNLLVTSEDEEDGSEQVN